MLTIRLMRTGKKSRPYFRIVAQESKRKVQGAYRESLGHYDPRDGAGGLKINLEKVKVWEAKGASVSPTVRTLMKKAEAAA